MIYKPLCPYARRIQDTGALFCQKVNGLCAFQYYCQVTGMYENTPTAQRCKAIYDVPKPANIESEKQTSQQNTESTPTTNERIESEHEKQIVPTAEHQGTGTVRTKRGRRKRSNPIPSDGGQESAN